MTEVADIQNFNRLKHEFESAVNQVPEELGLFKDEFEKLYHTLVKSHESEERLVRRSKEILSEISCGQDQMGQEKNEEEDAVQYRKRLQLDIEVAWSQVAESHKLETEKQAKLNELRTNIGFLKEQISNGSGWSEDQEQMMSKLKRKKIDSLQELDLKTTTWNQLKMEITGIFDAMKEKEEETVRLGDESVELTSAINKTRTQTDQEARRRTALERSLRNLKFQVEEAKQKGEEYEKRVEESKRELSRKEHRLRETKKNMEVYLREYENLSRRETMIDQEIKTQHHT